MYVFLPESFFRERGTIKYVFSYGSDNFQSNDCAYHEVNLNV